MYKDNSNSNSDSDSDDDPNPDDDNNDNSDKKSKRDSKSSNYIEGQSSRDGMRVGSRKRRDREVEDKRL